MINLGITVYQLFIFCLWPLIFAFLFGYYSNQPAFSKKLLYGSNSIFLGILIGGASVAIKWEITEVLQPNIFSLEVFEGISLISTSLLFLLFYMHNTLENNNELQLSLVTYWHYINRALLTTLQMCALTRTTTAGVVILGFFVAHIIILMVIVIVIKIVNKNPNSFRYIYLTGVTIMLARGLFLTNIGSIGGVRVYEVQDCCSLSSGSWVLLFHYLFGFFGTLRIGDILIMILMIELVIIIALLLRLPKSEKKNISTV